jgi:hypothetical protein
MRLHFVDVLYFSSILHEISHHFSIRFFVPTIILLLVFVLLCCCAYYSTYYHFFLLHLLCLPLFNLYYVRFEKHNQF